MKQFDGMKNHDVFMSLCAQFEKTGNITGEQQRWSNWFVQAALKDSGIDQNNFDKKDGSSWLQRSLGVVAGVAKKVWSWIVWLWKKIAAACKKGWAMLFNRKAESKSNVVEMPAAPVAVAV